MLIYSCREEGIISLGTRIYPTGTSGVKGRVRHEPFSFFRIKKGLKATDRPPTTS